MSGALSTVKALEERAAQTTVHRRPAGSVGPLGGGTGSTYLLLSMLSMARW